MRRDVRSHLPPDIAAVAELLGRVRARIILEEADGHRIDATDAGPPAILERLAPTRLLMRVAEVAEALSISRSAVYELIRSGEIPAVKIGRSTRVSVDALKRWIHERER